MTDDKNAKTSGFGIGELGSVPASTPADDLLAAQINAEQELTWEQKCQREATCVTCGATISERVYFSGTMGCRVMCERHWIEYHAKHRLDAPRTFDGIMAEMQAEREAERKRVKHCAACGSTSAAWNSGAGQDLCSRHWDSY